MSSGTGFPMATHSLEVCCDLCFFLHDALPLSFCMTLYRSHRLQASPVLRSRKTRKNQNAHRARIKRKNVRSCMQGRENEEQAENTQHQEQKERPNDGGMNCGMFQTFVAWLGLTAPPGMQSSCSAQTLSSFAALVSAGPP